MKRIVITIFKKKNCISFRTESLRYIKAVWPKDFALFNLKNTYSSQNLDQDIQGTVNIEVPMESRHITNLVYGLKKRPLLTTGHCEVQYNKNKLLNGQYRCKSESSAGFEKDVVDITIENAKKPIGITYIHVYEQSGIDGPQYVSVLVLL